MSLQQFCSDLHNKALTNQQIYTSFQNFITYYTGLKTAFLGTTTYTDKQLSEHIFKSSIKKSEEELVCKKISFAAYNTLIRLNSKITEDNVSQYRFLLRSLGYDMYGIVRYIEEDKLNNTLNFQLASRPDQNARETFDISRALFEFGTINPERFYQREIIPVSVFVLRQTIEVYGKRTLGFGAVINERGERARVSTQVSWEFIKKEILKGKGSRITLPTDLDIVLKVEQWTNSYVHTGDIPEIFLIENAIHLTDPLIYPMNTTQSNYKKAIHFNATSRLRSYNSIKSDFEIFVNKNQGVKNFWQKVLIFLRLRKRPSRYNVLWMNVDSVDAIIESL